MNIITATHVLDEILDDFIERQLVLDHHTRFVKEDNVYVRTSPILTQLDHLACTCVCVCLCACVCVN